ncbi:MAG: hypothetical protein HUJ92_07150 [Bacteroidales bacterium]|nr:hypothetical protein [Bacteroidales bacterium]
MKFKDIVNIPCGIRFCFEDLSIEAGYSRRVALDAPLMTSVEQIEASYGDLRLFRALNASNPSLIRDVKHYLQCSLHDISGALKTLRNGDYLEDINLFEIKNLAILGDNIGKLFSAHGVDIKWLDFPMSRVIDILDPDGLRIASFYIYDSYSIELRTLRQELEYFNGDDDERSALMDDIATEEDRIREIIAGKLLPLADDIEGMLHSLARLDIAIAKAAQAEKWNLVIPEHGDKTILEGMYNPEIEDALQKKRKAFQRVNFLHQNGEPSVVIGANMGGKTVALKTLTLCQLLYQTGFAVPAEKAVMHPFEEIYFCIGDEQDQIKGLSSFAAEMLRINQVIERMREGVSILALIDEPARTTNPVEGTALVSALVNLISGRENIDLVLTTHYNIKCGAQVAFWRVRGLVEGKMDYELLPTAGHKVPHEALAIAESLKIDSQWINGAKEMLERQKTTV